MSGRSLPGMQAGRDRSHVQLAAAGGVRRGRRARTGAAAGNRTPPARPPDHPGHRPGLLNPVRRPCKRAGEVRRESARRAQFTTMVERIAGGERGGLRGPPAGSPPGPERNRGSGTRPRRGRPPIQPAWRAQADRSGRRAARNQGPGHHQRAPGVRALTRRPRCRPPPRRVTRPGPSWPRGRRWCARRPPRSARHPPAPRSGSGSLPRHRGHRLRPPDRGGRAMRCFLPRRVL